MSERRESLAVRRAVAEPGGQNQRALEEKPGVVLVGVADGAMQLDHPGTD